MSFVIGFILYIIFCFGLSGMLSKMNLDPLYAWIPVYNLYLLIKETWSQVYFWILMALGFTTLLMENVYNVHGQPFILSVWVMQMLWMMVWLLCSIHVAVSFHKGALMGFLFALFPFIAAPVLSGSAFIGKRPSLANVRETFENNSSHFHAV